jgi:hypothetical protein
MKTLELKYNSFTLKTDFFIDGKIATLDCFGTGEEVRLRDRIADFFPAAMKKCFLGPSSDCIIQFYGTQDAFEDVKAAYQKYSGQSESVKIELPEYKPYPNNFNEMNILIDGKRKHFDDLINNKKEELVNPSVGKNNVELLDIEKQFDRDKNTIERIYMDNLGKTNTVVEKAKEGIDFLSSAKEEIKLMEEKAKTPSFTITSKEVKEKYDKIIEDTNSAYTKNVEELTLLLSPLFEKIETALCSQLQAIYTDYATTYSDFSALNYTLQKYKQNGAIEIKKSIPDSCFDKMKVLNTSSAVRFSIVLINGAIEKTISSCLEYFDSIFESAKNDFCLETEKCKAYYLEELLELQETIKEKLTSTKHIEREITAFENKIECLDELQNEINKLTAN